MQALADYTVESLTVWKATQTGGSTLAEAFVAFLLAFAPANLLYNTPDHKKTRKQANRTIQKLKRVTLVDDIVNRDGWLKENVTGERGISPFFLQFQTANEESMNSDTVGKMVNDELWLWAKGVKGYAENRAGSFTFPKELNVSSAGDKGTDADLAYQEGTQEEYFLRCQRPSCQELFWPLYGRRCSKEYGELLQRYNGEQIFVWKGDDYESVVAMCPHCGFAHPDVDLDTRWRMGFEGEYQRQNDDAPSSKVSCRWNGFVSHMRRWWKIIRRIELGLDEMREGRGSNNFRMTVLTDLVEPYDEIAPDRADPVYTADYAFELHEPESLPFKVWHGPERGHPQYWLPEWRRFMLVDVGADHFWVTVRLFGTNGASRLHFATKVVGGWGDLDKIQAYFGIKSDCVFVDVGTFKKEVQFTLANVALRGWRGLEGSDQRGFGWKFKIKLRKPTGADTPEEKELARLRKEFPPDKKGVSTIEETRVYSEIIRRPATHDFGAGPERLVCKVVRWSNWHIKTHLYGLRNGKYQEFGTPENHEVAGGRPSKAKYPSEYAYQMDSEAIKEKVQEDGTLKELWDKKHANHYWDCECQGWLAYLAASDARKWLALQAQPQADLQRAIQNEASRRSKKTP